MSSTNPIRLSKSKVASFEHCHRRLWLQVHRRSEAQFDPDTLARFQFGHDVGAKARFLAGSGWLIETGWDMDAAVAETKSLIDDGFDRPIFEATFIHANVLIRADVLEPLGGGAWQLTEVKATGRVRDYHIADAATQAWVARGSGLNVAKVTIRHLANRIDWRRPDIGAVRFTNTDITDHMDRFIATRPALAAAASVTVAGSEPQIPVGMHCYRPFACEFRNHCMRQVGTV